MRAEGTGHSGSYCPWPFIAPLGCTAEFMPVSRQQPPEMSGSWRRRGSSPEPVLFRANQFWRFTALWEPDLFSN